MGAEQIRQQQLLQQQQMLYQQQQAGGYGQPPNAQQPKVSKQQQVEIEGEKTAYKLNSHMVKIDDMIAKKTHEADLKEERIK